MSLMEQLEALAKECDTEEQELIEEMIFNAAEYVKAVVVMETTARNLLGREADTYRDAVTSTDCTRTTVHNGLISAVNVVNRICQNHSCPLIYTGDEQRRHYGDFAQALIMAIFEERK